MLRLCLTFLFFFYTSALNFERDRSLRPRFPKCNVFFPCFSFLGGFTLGVSVGRWGGGGIPGSVLAVGLCTFCRCSQLYIFVLIISPAQHVGRLFKETCIYTIIEDNNYTIITYIPYIWKHTSLAKLNTCN